MASWPGVLPPFRSPIIPTGEFWTDTQSEIYPRRSVSVDSSLSTGHEQGRQDRPRGSTISKTLHPLSPRLSEASPPQTTSTAPILPHDPVNNGSRGECTASSSKPANKAQQWPWALPSGQFPLSNEVTPSQNDGAKLVKLLEAVINIHEEVATKRFQALDMRHALRHKREEEDDRRVTLRNRLNLIPLETVQGELVALNAAIEDLQVVTASYRELEFEYHKLEDDLGQREYIHDKYMRKLAERLHNQAPVMNQQVYNIDSDSDSSTNYGSTGSGNQLSSQTAEYLSCVGEVRMLREGLSGLESEYLASIDQCELNAGKLDIFDTIS